DGAQLGFPEVTLPVVPGMEGCHWPFRKASREQQSQLLSLLLTGRPVAASKATGWLVDFAGPMDAVLSTAWNLANGRDASVARRPFEAGAITGVPTDVPGLP